MPEPGSVIYIPQFENTLEKNVNNRVYNSPNVKDNLGRDILLTADGDLAIGNNDFLFIESNDNLTQNILNRLSTVKGSVTREPRLGISGTVGDRINNTYLKASIEQTLEREPRIKTVEGVTIKNKNDGVLSINVEYTDINDKVGTVGV